MNHPIKQASMLDLAKYQKSLYSHPRLCFLFLELTDWKTAIDREYGEITKKTAERVNLERKILCDSYGTDPFALHKECPACKGKMIAGIRNRSWEEQNGDAVDFDENGTDIDNDAVYVDESSVQLREDPVYQCLQCGKKF